MSSIRLSQQEIREKLLTAARHQFIRNGIVNTEMKAIAEEAGLSRSTLYRYVIDRNQLAFMVSSVILTELTESCMEQSVIQGKNGYKKLESFVRSMVDTLTDNVGLVNFLNEFDSIFRSDYPNIEEARNYSVTMNRMLHRSAQFIFEGMADGSIRQIPDPLLFGSSLMNTLFGLSERLLPRDEHYQIEHHYAGRDLILNVIGILLQSIAA